MNDKKKNLSKGVGLLAGFAVVLIIIFSPVFSGHNGLEYLDSLYNSISKGSAYYIPQVREETKAFEGKSVTVTLTLADAAQAAETAVLLAGGGAQVETSGEDLKVSGDLSKLLENCIVDADSMYHNDAEALFKKYGYEGRRALYNWWNALSALEKGLTKQKEFKEAKVTSVVMQKAVETAYNYHGIKAEKISGRLGVVVFSLVFYVVYTLWYGFAILYLFEGAGLKLGH